MRASFDTSVLVAAVVKEMPDHHRAVDCLKRLAGDGVEICSSSHALAECYSTLTSLPIRKRILPLEAAQIIETNLMNRLTILEIPSAVYVDAIRNVADLGYRSGMIYDGLHLACAEAAGCERHYTFNMKHFLRLKPKGIEVVSP